MFKQTKLLMLTVLLTGCSYLTPIQYDNNEYELLARLETSVQLIQENCVDRFTVISHIPTLVHDSKLLHTYTFYIPANTETYQMVDILKNDIREFELQYDLEEDSRIYCRLKTQVFLLKVREALKVVATKRRL